ncbi:MAG TPA: DUF2892 domain-containing protein [Kofleriaceae bacterium]|nr:DUF2892 domain-containing protein [Kofleriaceae bacterium]
MTIERMVLLFAGFVVLVSTLLAATVSAKFLLVTGFVGADLLQASFTGFCPLAAILRRAGRSPGPAFR